ncbi:MAG TPA: cold-shock protein, partial [Elusimicrobiota bacterium]|nr:cold-shock protein [Elusimicrobiota bacterium]
MKGKVKWYNRVKGYGFLIPEDGSAEVFVHHSAIQAKGKDKVLVDGQAVEFEVTQ